MLQDALRQQVPPNQKRARVGRRAALSARTEAASEKERQLGGVTFDAGGLMALARDQAKLARMTESAVRIAPVTATAGAGR